MTGAGRADLEQRERRRGGGADLEQRERRRGGESEWRESEKGERAKGREEVG